MANNNGDIVFELVTDGNIEQCRELCNELMAFQQAQAVIAPQAFDSMNFETRLLSTYQNSPLNQLIVAKHNGTPIGYVFSTIEDVAQGDKSAPPEWAPKREGVEMLGFYPRWQRLPDKVGCLSQLYVRQGYRGLRVGEQLLERAMAWLEGFPDVDLTFVYISNGNSAALDFYLRHGFTYSHEVFGGFIQAAYKYKAEALTPAPI